MENFIMYYIYIYIYIYILDMCIYIYREREIILCHDVYYILYISNDIMHYVSYNSVFYKFSAIYCHFISYNMYVYT